MTYIIQSGSRQYKVEKGQTVIVDLLKGVKEGDTVDLNVLFAFGDDKVGKLSGTVLTHQRGEKIRVLKYMRKSNYKRQYGARQEETVIQIEGGSKKAETTPSTDKASKRAASSDDSSIKAIKVVKAKTKTIAKKALEETAPLSAAKSIAKKASEKKETTATKSVAKKTTSKKEADDLTKIEGVGPKIAELLIAAKLVTFKDVSEVKSDVIAKILEEAGPRYNIHDPSSWPKQAKLAADDKWDELNILQEKLKGGK